MKILTNKEYNKLISDNKSLENTKNDSEYQYKKIFQDYDLLIEDLHNELQELRLQTKQGMSKDKIKLKLDEIIKKIGGR